MKIYLLSFITVFCLSSEVAAQLQEGESSLTRTELKQSVSKMTYESGDRRILKLDGKLEDLQDVKTPKGKSTKLKTKPYPDITVQCSPIGAAEAIGVLPKKSKKYEPKAYGEEIEIDAPLSLNIPDDDWRRIATLACLEDEI